LQSMNISSMSSKVVLKVGAGHFVASIIAKIPAFTTSERLSHASTTSFKASGEVD